MRGLESCRGWRPRAHHHPRPEIGRRDADRDLAPYCRHDLGVGLGRHPHIGADAARPQEIDPRRPGSPGSPGSAWRDRRRDQAAPAPRRQTDRLRRAQEDPPSADLAGVSVAQDENATSKRRWRSASWCRVRRRIEEDVAVIEGGDQPDRRRQQHAVAEDVARHVATPTTVKGVVIGSTSISWTCRFTASKAPRAVIPIFLWS